MSKEPTIYAGEKHLWEHILGCKKCGGVFPKHDKSCKYYHEKGRIVGIHRDKGCGGNIIVWNQRRQCEKCEEFFATM